MLQQTVMKSYMTCKQPQLSVLTHLNSSDYLKHLKILPLENVITGTLVEVVMHHEMLQYNTSVTSQS